MVARVAAANASARHVAPTVFSSACWSAVSLNSGYSLARRARSDTRELIVVTRSRSSNNSFDTTVLKKRTSRTHRHT